VFCSRCGYENRSGANFCARCGASLSSPQDAQTENKKDDRQGKFEAQPSNSNQTQAQSTITVLKRHWTATLAAIVWILTALANFYLVIANAIIGNRIGFGLDLLLTFLSAAAVYDFFDGDKEALYFATAAIVIAFIFDVIAGAWITVAEVIVIAIFTYLPFNHLVKDGIKAHNYKIVGAN
jgi:cation transport ATPase